MLGKLHVIPCVWRRSWVRGVSLKCGLVRQRAHFVLAASQSQLKGNFEHTHTQLVGPRCLTWMARWAQAIQVTPLRVVN